MNWKKQFYLIFTGQSISLLGSRMAQFAIVWYLIETTNSASIIALSSAIGILPEAIIGPFAGVIVDRYSRKRVMILSDALVGLGALVLAIAYFLGNLSLPLLFIVLGFRSISNAFHKPAYIALTPNIVPEDQLLRVSGLNQSLAALTQILGPVLGILVLSLSNLSVLMLIDVIGAMFACLTLLKVKLKEVVNNEVLSLNDFKEDLKQGYISLTSNQGIFIIILLAMLLNFLATPMSTLMPLLSTNHFNGDGFHASLINSLIGVGMIIGGILIATLLSKLPQTKIIFVGVILIGLFKSSIALLQSNHFILFSIILFCIGILVTLVNGPLFALIQKEIKQEYLGRTTALITSVATIAAPLGLILMGPLSEIFGIQTIFLSSGLIFALAGILVYIKFNKVIIALDN